MGHQQGADPLTATDGTLRLANLIFEGLRAARICGTKYQPSKKKSLRFYPEADYEDALHRARFAYEALSW